MSSAIIFGLLIALMLTGMPISIALGLTVLTFLFFLTHVPIEGVARKLFSGLDGRPLVRRPRPRGGAGLRVVRGHFRLFAGDRGGNRLHPDPGDGAGGL